ncbi:hypothetical protein GYB59_23540 [bacterium]|nr:hypothetical protein [bacterium]
MLQPISSATMILGCNRTERHPPERAGVSDFSDLRFAMTSPQRVVQKSSSRMLNRLNSEDVQVDSCNQTARREKREASPVCPIGCRQRRGTCGSAGRNGGKRIAD